jgi:eukaryotic-like serine/threonine-protein kinase
MSGETLLNGRYRLISQQGSGGMAVVYRAVDELLGRNVAVKVLRPSLTADPTFIVRFQNEARSIANLSHPNIVTVHDVGSDGPTHYMVMELVDGQDLKKIIRSHGALGINRALSLAIGICGGIGYAHHNGIVHADIKPQNILVTRDDVVKITDFGIAQALSDTQPVQRQSVVWGSPHYFAPEQAQGEKPSAVSDVYSIGIVLFEMLTGRLPYTGSNQQELALAHIRVPVPMANEFNPNIPEKLAEIVHQAMSKERTNRFRMADQLGGVLIDYRDRGRSNTMASAPVSERPAQQNPLASAAPPATPPPEAGERAAPQSPKSPPQTPPPPMQQPRAGTPPYPHRPQAPPPPVGPPTQRYNPAPEAPAPVNYNRSGKPTTPYTNTQSRPMAPQSAHDSRPFPAQMPYNRIADDLGQENSFQLDGVTIALGILAFLSVACLLPLYIAVLQARLG